MEEDKGDEDVMRKLQEALDSDPSNPSHHFNLGCTLWKKGEEEDSNVLKGRAVEHFVTSAKFNPSNGAAFRYLGHYYSRVSLDTQRAAKCYQRAVALSPDDSEAGEALCDVLDAEGKESLEVAVCKETSQRSPRAFWAFRRLGYLQVHQKRWLESVQSLQHAIRGYPACADLWEALGLAYHRMGMFTAALKSYGRAIELEGSKIFALVESGCILSMLGSFRKGIEQFRSALNLSPDNVSACFGLASALLGLSKECTNSGFFSWATSLLEEAANVVKTCPCLVGNISSMQKLHGDIQMAHAMCLPWYKESSDIKIDAANFEISIHGWRRTRLSLAINAKHSYQRALHLAPWQANYHTDVAISLDMVSSLNEKDIPDRIWNLPERMSLGGLMLEGENSDIWVVLGCLSNNNALKQHAFIRGLQLDASLAAAWAHLGKLYRRVGEKKLAKQAFDHARSIDPSLALPWAGLSASIDISTGEKSLAEAYESCLRASQILPHADFQAGLGSLATLYGHLLSPQVFSSIKQAVQHAPFYAELHNLNGLVCEARSDFQSAIAAYRRAKCALNIFPMSDLNSSAADLSVNLARSLCLAGYALDAARECENLKEEGLLDEKGQEIYVVALFELGKKDLALTEARHLASRVSKMNDTSRAAALGLICKLLYCAKGLESTVATIVKFPKEYFEGSKINLIIYAMNAFGRSMLQSVLVDCKTCPMSADETSEMHYLFTLKELISNADMGQNFGIQNAVNYLKKTLHMYPNDYSIRTQLSSLLLSSNGWMASHIAERCLVIHPGHSLLKFSKSPYEVLGSAAVACYASCTAKKASPFLTCRSQNSSGIHGLHQLQKWLHQEPWNYKAHYLLVLNVLQKAREENFPWHICAALKRMVFTVLSKERYAGTNLFDEYQKFQLLLCVSEICLQCGDYRGCVNYATNASKLLVSKNALFFGHLQMCRAYAALGDLQNLSKEHLNCLQVKTDYEIGWVSLKYFDYKYKLNGNLNHSDLNYGELERESPTNMWAAILDFVLCQKCIWDMDFIHAEEALSHANSTGSADRCLLLCHGAICMELARQGYGSQFLPLARSSLIKAQKSPLGSLPIVSILLAQAEGSLGSKSQWEKNIRAEWSSWPPAKRPAEIYFQMHLLARQSIMASNQETSIELSQRPERWVLRAIHLNPSCLRYWKILQNLKE